MYKKIRNSSIILLFSIIIGTISHGMNKTKNIQGIVAYTIENGIRLFDLAKEKDVTPANLAKLERDIFHITFNLYEPNLLAFTERDRSIITIWDLNKDAEIRTIDTKYKFLGAIAFSPIEPQILVSASNLWEEDNTYVKIWNIGTGECIAKIVAEFPVTSICCNPNNKNVIATGSNDGRINIWNIFETEEQKHQATLEGHRLASYAPEYLSSVLFNRYNPDQLISKSTDCTIKVWDTKTKTCTKTIETNALYSHLAHNPHNPLIVASGADKKTITIFDVSKADGKECIQKLKPEENGCRITSINFSPYNSDILVSANSDNTITVWNWKTGTCIKEFPHMGTVLTFQPLITSLKESNFKNKIKHNSKYTNMLITCEQ